MELYEYEELIERLAKDGYIQKKGESKTVPQTFFKEAGAYMQQRYAASSISNGWGVAWEHIRKTVLWSYGVSTISQIPLEKKEEANERAIKLIDALFD